jgi:sugar O-acyltransferase (sialic acid O-acetyltransferase NeuD family)
MKKKILIAGSGGFSKEVLCLIKDLDLFDNVLGFIEPDFIIEQGNTQNIVLGKPVLPYSIVDPNEHIVSVAIGEPHIRERAINRLPSNLEYLSLVHPSSTISEWVEIEHGAIICAGTIMTCDIKIGKHAQLNLNTTIGHDCEIGDFFTTGPGVNISGNCKFGNRVYFGTSSCIKQGLSVVDNVIIGMGAVVTKSIDLSGVYVGNPARKIK